MSISVSGPSSPLQQIPDVGKGPGETSTDDEIGKRLDVYPRQLCFPFEPNKLIRCAVTLTNRTEYYVGVWITLSYPDRRLGFGFPIMCGNESFQDTFSYFSEMMDPHSTLAVPMTMKELQRLPLLNTGKFVVLMIVMRQKEHIEKLMKASNMESDLLNGAQELGAMVNRVVLTASIGDPACCQAVIANYKPKVVLAACVLAKIHRKRQCDRVFSVNFCHLFLLWLLASQKGGSVSIWNYQTQVSVILLRFSTQLTFTKFIAREHWLVSGDDDGSVHVYTYTTMGKVKEFIAHHDRHPVDVLSVHPSCQFLLTASTFVGTPIKLWDWGQAWICTRTINMPNTRLHHLSWNPRDTNGFASVSNDYNNTLKIWNLQTKECVHRLGLSGWDIYDMACHPTLPILATSHSDGSIVCLWDTRAYR
ncbi:hypothetical protein SETIT_8G071300v2 [Setaria italica]|uniref:Uncharacterized protein n=1 Tax=Setaria italica TaxID=4555 RepID=A0A368S528_SETIT|nr:hypothetical protein SETIT_8G071300v2 [Setaria italica]